MLEPTSDRPVRLDNSQIGPIALLSIRSDAPMNLADTAEGTFAPLKSAKKSKGDLISNFAIFPYLEVKNVKFTKILAQKMQQGDTKAVYTGTFLSL